MERKLQGSHLLAIVLCSVLLVGYLFGPNLYATWSVFGDHEIMWFLGPADRRPLSQLVPKLMQTELNPQSTLPRFRPAYWPMRMLEAWAWGKTTWLWYASHLLMLLIFVVTIWILAARRIGWLAAGLVSVFTISYGYWSGIIPTLSPGETYAALGLAIYLIGADRVWRKPEAAPGWVCLFTGTLIAAGSKENFVLIVLPTLFLAVRGLRSRRLNWIAWPTTGAGLIWCAWITWVVGERVRAARANVYGEPVGMGHMARVLLGGILDARLIPFYLAAVAFALLWLYWRKRNATLARGSWIGALWAVLLIGLYLSQVVFYNGTWPTDTRYDFPGMLAWPALLFLIFWYLRAVEDALPEGSATGAVLTGIGLLAGIAAIVLNASGLTMNRQVSEKNVTSTAAYMAMVGRIAEQARSQPAYPVVVQSDDPADLEALGSYADFFKAAPIPNEIYLLWIPRRGAISNYQGSISDQLTAMSQQGVPGEFEPIAGLEAAGDRCILVVISGPPHRTCQITIQADWRPMYH